MFPKCSREGVENHDWLLDYAREMGWRVGWTCKVQFEGKFTVWCWVKTNLIERPYRFGIQMHPVHTLEHGIESSASLAFGAIGPKGNPWSNERDERWKPSWLRETEPSQG